MNIKYYLVIVNFNNSKVTIDCILSAKKILHKSFSEIVIADNNSNITDLSLLTDFIQQNLDLNISLITLDSNIGYFSAINRGIMSLDLFGRNDFILVIGNNDLLFPSNFTQSIAVLTIDKDVFVISPDIVTLDGIHQNPHVINRLSLFRRLAYKIYFISYPIACVMTYIGKILRKKRRNYSRYGYDKEQVIRMGFGACYIILPQFIREIGLLDEGVFLMGEEALLANQVYVNGGKIMYSPHIQVIHQDHSTFKKLPSLKTYEMTKKSYAIYKKYL